MPGSDQDFGHCGEAAMQARLLKGAVLPEGAVLPAWSTRFGFFEECLRQAPKLSRELQVGGCRVNLLGQNS